MDCSAKNAEPERLYQSLADTEADTAVSVILKVRGETCDIDCLYCYEKRKEAPGSARSTCVGSPSFSGAARLRSSCTAGSP